MTRLIVLAMLLTLAAQARDAGQEPPSRTTATISGVVTSEEPNSRPIRRVFIEAQATDGIATGRTVMTDDQGRFALNQLPAGRYFLVAEKVGWIRTPYGAKRFSRAPTGVPIVLAAGQQLTNLSFKMPRGAVIAGRLVDEAGRPLSGFRPTILEWRTIGGERQLMQVYGSGAGLTTDDRGEFRIFGLPAGTFLLAATAPFSGYPGLRATSPAEVAWARQLEAQGTAMAAAPPPGRIEGYAPTYFPGVDDPAAAAAVTLGPGEERTDFEFIVRRVPTTRVSGVIVRSDGQPVRNAQVSISAARDAAAMVGSITSATTARPIPDPTGRFSAPALPPGRYVVRVRASSAPPAPSGRSGAAGPAASRPVNDLWASAEFLANGEPIEGLTLTLQQGVTVSGRIAVDTSGAATKPLDLSQLRLQMLPANASGSLSASTGNVYINNANADGTFTMSGVAPDRYVISGTSLIGAIAQGWMLKSVFAGGRDVTAGTFDIQTADVADVVVTVTDRVGEISGLLIDAAGRPAPDYFVFVFPADRAAWTPLSRRLRAPVRPASDGKFTISQLPPGEYLIAALAESQDDAYLDTSFIEQVVPGAIKIALREGEKKVQDIRIK